ncbi:armadillo repeat-containing protein 2 isoform X2 [Daktulosphaira vitifoliae]|uniref:armadillo repeat-containing protein 2 isoform X2 n=1 Tax=Daktulosphaira vitifoliae TaxID=58002 RepID=UPI0021AAA423|nr:armadillo repeat-containing protein 2 isoform X2 [Daktulosphaira vitifoliae]
MYVQSKLPKTSSEIISEAKAALQMPSHIKPLMTNRPFTPRERVLFGNKRVNRPSSVLKLQQVQFQDKKNSNCTKLPLLEKSKYLNYIEDVKRQTRSSPPHAVRKRSNSDLAYNNKLSEKKISSLSFPLSIDALLKNHYEPNYYDHEYMSHENEINEARASFFSTHPDCFCVISLIENTMMKKNWEIGEMCSLLDKLANAIKHEHLGIIRDENKKSFILRTVFRLANSSTNDELIIHILLVLLQMSVSGKYLMTVCKLFFKVSRLDKNDRLFLETDVLNLFVDALGLATPNEDAESLIYGYGALKFLTMNPALMERAMSNGCLPLMLLHLKMINLERTERPKLPESITHVLFQLTGALRNVINNSAFYPELISSGGLATIYRNLELFSDDIDVITNISRIVSILSTDNKCCDTLVESWTNVSVLISLLEKYPDQAEVVVRITYALGNILTNNEKARYQLYDQHCSVGTLLNLLQLYLEKDLISLSQNFELNLINDVLIKVIRVIVNMSIQPEIGSKLVMKASENHSIYKVKECEQFLDALLTVLRRKSVDEDEELVYAALVALNNLSYFDDMGSHGPFSSRQLDITQALSLMLNTRNYSSKVEVIRVFGNLTRSNIVRNYLLETGVFVLIICFCVNDQNSQLWRSLN